MAASFRRFSRSAPANPAVVCATRSRFTSSPSGLFFACTSRISSLPFTSGLPTYTLRSKRPGLKIAGSRISTRLVAAITMIPSFTPNPSISTRSWFSVCSLSSCPPPIPVPLRLATASISSIKTIHGAFFFASSNKSLTLDAPTPTNISTKSEPEMLKNGTPASPAIAFARSVLPVPGGPTRITPFGILAPTSIYFAGYFRKSTISSSSSFSSHSPATLSNVYFPPSGLIIFARLFPKFIILEFPPPPPPPAFELSIVITTKAIITTTISGSTVVRNTLSLCTSLIEYFTSAASISLIASFTSDTYSFFTVASLLYFAWT